MTATILGTAGLILDSGGLYLVSFLFTFSAGVLAAIFVDERHSGNLTIYQRILQILGHLVVVGFVGVAFYFLGWNASQWWVLLSLLLGFDVKTHRMQHVRNSSKTENCDEIGGEPPLNESRHAGGYE